MLPHTHTQTHKANTRPPTSRMGKDVSSEKGNRHVHKMPNGTESALLFLLFEAAANTGGRDATIAMSIVAMSPETHGWHKDSHIMAEGKARWQSLSNMTLPNSPHLKPPLHPAPFYFPLVKGHKMSLQNCKEDIFTSTMLCVQIISKISENSLVSIYTTHMIVQFVWLPPFNPLNPELNPICYLLALLVHHFLHVSRIRVK